MEWTATKIWNDCECWIIGGGSSISEQFNIPSTFRPNSEAEYKEYGNKLSAIHKKRIIGVNVAAFLGSWVDVAYWGDNSTYLDFKHRFDTYSGLKISSGGKFANPDITSVLYLQSNPKEPFCLNKDSLCWKQRNSGAAAINLAYHLGARKVVLLGYDMLRHPEGHIHWHGGYPDKRRTPTISQRKKDPNCFHPRTKPSAPFDRHMNGFPGLAKKAEKYGMQIVNANPNSRLDCFPKMTVDEILEGKAWR